MAFRFLVLQLLVTTIGQPSAKAATSAAELVRRFDQLSKAEHARLSSMGREAVRELLPLVRTRLKAFDREGCEEISWEYKPARRRVLRPLGTLLEVASCGQSERIYKLLPFVKCIDTSMEILGWLRRCDSLYGDRRRLLEFAKSNTGSVVLSHPLFIDALVSEVDESTLAYFRQVLVDVNTSEKLSEAAYLYLPRGGRADDLAMVRRLRRSDRRSASLEEISGVDDLPGCEPGSWCGTDYDGRARVRILESELDLLGNQWALFVSSGLGSRSDLWVALWNGQRWINPMFTGKTAEDIKQDWVMELVCDPAVWRDSDSDGWPDLVEGRFGTNPMVSDSDGDGLPDSEDLNPLVPPRALGDLERILAVAFEARIHARTWNKVPAIVVMPAGVEPMELYGSSWPILARRRGEQIPLDAVHGDGTALVKIRAVLGNLSNESLAEDGFEVDVDVGVFYGSLNANGFTVKLRRIGGEWYAIGLESRWVS